MTMVAEDIPVPAFPVLQEARHTRHGRRTRARDRGNSAVRTALLQLTGDFEPLAPSLQFRKRTDVTEKI